MRGRIAFTDEILAEVRRHKRNATRDVGLMALDKLRALEAVAEDPLASEWRIALSNRLIRARFDAANALIRRHHWSDAAAHLLNAVTATGSPVRKGKGVLRVGLTAALAIMRAGPTRVNHKNAEGS
jgi:hypothetical protein